MEWALLVVGAGFVIVVYGIDRVISMRRSAEPTPQEMPDWAKKTLDEIEKGVDYL